ncbi:MAG TPA: ATP-binding protein [Caldimonas sp.]|jgi:signal transduction histidine kinase/ActR/RegA family two-component response regulator|nr:ATP-binding protein [Caldimonas sp.]HEX2542901.1 ATP-binding protein [Caldimonas sp.]
MLAPVLTVSLQSDHSLVMLRDRCRQVGELFGLETLQRTRLTTAVSEIGRNALQHAGGAVVHFLVGDASRPAVQAVLVRVTDKGAGIATSVWRDGALVPGLQTRGLHGSQRLVDGFWIETAAGKGTSVFLEMHLRREAAYMSTQSIQDRVDELIRRKPRSPREELEHQNREMLHTLEELRQRQVELEQADTRKNEFVAMLAHELRNPLGAITMTLAVLRLKKDVGPEELQKYGNAIGRQASQLTKLVNDLMDVSRVSRGKVQLEREVVEVDVLVAQAIEMTRAFLDAKNQRLTLSSTPGKVHVDVDVVRMKQVLSNLIHNSARYSPEGGLVEVNVTSSGPAVSIAVKDYGIGIESDMLPRVFDLFAQGANGLARQGTGLGIGLTIVQRLVLDHGGTVTASSAGPAQGSEFVVTLATAPAPAPVAEPQAAAAHAASSLRVLLADDNEDAAAAVREMLELSGYACVVASDGVAAVQAATMHPPDIAIVDIGLPLLDGFGVVEALRRLRGEGLPIIAISGYSSPQIRARAERAGFSDYFVKPIDLPLLLERLRSAQAGLGA